MYKKRIVVKVGTNVLINRDKRIVKPILAEIVRQIAYLYEQNIWTVLVTSGSIIAGKELLHQNTIENKDIREQVYSAVGQPRLMRFYYTLFAEYGMRSAQVLATKHDFNLEEQRTNMLNCYNGLLSQGIIPVANEDDVTSLREIKFSDNDELASNIAELIDANQLILLSDIDGVYNGSPSDPNTKRFTTICPTDEVEQYIRKTNKGEGESRGGMRTKLKIAKKAASRGIPTVIARGKTKNVIIDLMEGKALGTRFISEPAPFSN